MMKTLMKSYLDLMTSKQRKKNLKPPKYRQGHQLLPTKVTKKLKKML